MNTTSKPELISFKLCPFVQRAIIILLEKAVDFEITYIDLEAPPSWFQSVSPLGKVPILKAEGAVIFESAVISEYLEESYSPQLHPQTPLQRAHNRAWIEFGSELLFSQFRLYTATEESQITQHKQDIEKKLAFLETTVTHTPFFNGTSFSIVDATYAPLMMRFELLSRQFALDFYQQTPQIQAWAQALLGRETVKKSVVADFETLFLDWMRQKGNPLLK